MGIRNRGFDHIWLVLTSFPVRKQGEGRSLTYFVGTFSTQHRKRPNFFLVRVGMNQILPGVTSATLLVGSLIVATASKTRRGPIS